ncbi:unnamed protein product [Meganyctiphanes norvegica]|uniref:Uncharacterized protein n=1 Tax=Meganyctiphanes norvegica TaxID=48144 RepID=A0AAV2RF00_MEGNR
MRSSIKNLFPGQSLKLLPLLFILKELIIFLNLQNISVVNRPFLYNVLIFSITSLSSLACHFSALEGSFNALSMVSLKSSILSSTALDVSTVYQSVAVHLILNETYHMNISQHYIYQLNISHHQILF